MPGEDDDLGPLHCMVKLVPAFMLVKTHESTALVPISTSATCDGVETEGGGGGVIRANNPCN